MSEAAVPLELETVPGALLETKQASDGPVYYIDPARLVEVCTRLKLNGGFEQLTAVTAVDWWPSQPRFEVVYLIRSYRNKTCVRLIVRAGEGDEIDSLCEVWRSANWYEREVFDLFGIRFRHHPNLERILMPADWDGHPLRKDYPVHGHKYSYGEE